MNAPDGRHLDGDLLRVIDNLIATNFIQRARFDVLFSMVEALYDRAGASSLEGMSVREWFQREKHEQLERILIECEDHDPAAAAFVQREIDRHPDGSTPGAEV